MGSHSWKQKRRLIQKGAKQTMLFIFEKLYNFCSRRDYNASVLPNIRFSSSNSKVVFLINKSVFDKQIYSNGGKKRTSAGRTTDEGKKKKQKQPTGIKIRKTGHNTKE